MFVFVDDSLRLGIDCLAMLAPRVAIVHGWAMAPRAVPTEIAVVAGADGDCAIDYCTFHERPDIVPKQPGTVAVNGFTMVFAVPEQAEALSLVLLAGEAVVRADLRDPRIETDLSKATAERDGSITFALFRDCATTPALAPLLHDPHRPFGGFAEWMARLPVARGKATELGMVHEVEALATAAGEVMVALRCAQPLPRDAVLDAALVGYLRREDGGPPEVAVVPLADWHAAAQPAALVGYGRIDPAWLDRLQAMELVVQARLRPEEWIWLRAQPRAAAIPEFLDATCRGADPTTLGLLRQVIARREAAFTPALAALTPDGEAPEPGAPRLLLVLGADDPMAARLFHVTAADVEGRCDTLLVMGEAAAAVAQVFLRRGRIGAAVGAEATQALRDTAGRGGVIAVDAARYAEAVAAGRAGDAFGSPLGAAAVARLLMLHTVAGCDTALSDSLARLLRLRRGAGLGPVPRAWSSHHVADLVNDHLARLWATPPTPTAAEASRHV